MVRHTVPVAHPGLDDGEQIQYPLVEVLGNDCSANYFYADVESVVCGSEVCQVVPVRLLWNQLGEFTDFSLRKGIELEKEDGLPFNGGDYQQLRLILRDDNSPLRDYFKEGLVGQLDNNAADALSGATITINPPDAVVEGAVWTCYTLWHWANGDLVNYIHHKTAERSPDERLRNYLGYGDLSHRRFALEELTRRRVGEISTRQSVLSAVLAAPRLTHLTLEYASTLPTDAYRAFVLSLISRATPYTRIASLEHLSNASAKPNTAFLLKLSQGLNLKSSFQEVDLILRILEQADAFENDFEEATLKLLEHPDFVTARRAFYFLSHQPVSASGKARLEGFRKRYNDRL